MENYARFGAMVTAGLLHGFDALGIHWAFSEGLARQGCFARHNQVFSLGSVQRWIQEARKLTCVKVEWRAAP